MLHKDAPIADRHSPVNWSYADAATRNAATGFVAGDVDKLAYQESDGTYWILTAITPVWKSMNGVDAVNLASIVHAAPGKTVLADADEFPGLNSATGFSLIKATWANIKATLATWIGGGNIAGSFTTLAASGATALGGTLGVGDQINVTKTTVDGVGLKITNSSASGSYPFFAISQNGSSGSGVTSWANACVLEGSASGGLVLGGYVGDLILQTGRADRVRINNATGAITAPVNFSLTGPSSTLGYGAGSGGTVTQATSKSTAVTLNKSCGVITMNNEALAAGAVAGFVFWNSLITISSGVVFQPVGFFNYRIEVNQLASGLVYVRVTNISGGSLSDALAINFQVFSGAAS